jgi:carboxymethylenebutenolidase
MEMSVPSALDVKFKTFDGSDVDALLALPGLVGPRPSILLVHEIWGLEAHIRDVAMRYAKEGFVVLAPHLYSRPGQREILTSPNIEKAMQRIWGLPPERRRDAKFLQELISKTEGPDREVLRLTVGAGQARTEVFLKDLQAALTYIRSLPQADTSRVGGTGFCMGGGLTFQLATTGSLKAAVVFYGQAPEPIESVERLDIPVLAFYAGEDVGLNEGLPELLKAVVRYRKGFEMKVYQGTMHAFFNDTRRSYSREAASDAWGRAVSFFQRNLGAGVP